LTENKRTSFVFPYVIIQFNDVDGEYFRVWIMSRDEGINVVDVAKAMEMVGFNHH
jgi:hypothetical protein